MERRSSKDSFTGDLVTQIPSGETPAEPVVIKKYANRRLYNTGSSSYVTLEHLSEMVRSGVDFVVLDAKSGEDITRSVLAQIIFDQESRGQNLLPATFLRSLIRFYGDSMQSFLPSYLDMSMDAFARGQERLREQFRTAFHGKPSMQSFEEQARQNMVMFEQAMRLWAPFAANMLPHQQSPHAAGEPRGTETREAGEDTVAALRRQMETMQRQLDELSADKSRRKP